MSKSYYAYCLVRTDLPSLGRGKAIAHGMHAGNKMTYDNMVVPMNNGLPVDPNIIAWHQEGAGFGTTISLGCGREISLETMLNVVSAVRGIGGIADVVTDPTYPYQVDTEIVKLIDPAIHTADSVFLKDNKVMCFREEITTCYVFGEKNSLKTILGQFGLVPND